MMLQAGVAGQPIAHSLSPVIHGAWIEAAGLAAGYSAYGPADADAFETLVAWGRAGHLCGLNVTAPFKEQALALADTASPTARACGSANLLLFRDGEMAAESTDGIGLMAALEDQAPRFSAKGATVVVLGAGGAARAALLALMEAGADVVVLNRTRERAMALTRTIGGRVGDVSDLGSASLIINALSVPPPIDMSLLRDKAVVMDMTYRPLETPFLETARSRGQVGVDGLAMLIGQARPSFEAMFGVPVPDIDVRARALAALGEGVA